MAVVVKCGACDKNVYNNDPKLNIDGRFYHVKCAKCKDCGFQLSLSSYKKSSDFIEESFLLCQKHYDERFFLTRSKLKKNWVKSEQGSRVDIRIAEKQTPKSTEEQPQQQSAVNESREERTEVADKVFLVSKFNADTQLFEFQVENLRAEALTFGLNFTGSFNFQMADHQGQNFLSTYLSAEGNGKSEWLRMKKSDPLAPHDIALNLIVRPQEDLRVKKWGGVEGEDIVERTEIARGLILQSTFTFHTREFIFLIENSRAEDVEVDLDFSKSVNLRLRDEEEGIALRATLCASAGGVSSALVLVREDPQKDHDISMGVIIRSKVPPPPPPVQAESLIAAALVPESSYNSPVRPQLAEKRNSVRDLASQLARSGSTFIPSPMGFSDAPEDDVEVRFFGSQRMTLVKKASVMSILDS